MTATPASHIKFVYLHIGKTGGTYIKNLFQANDIGETQGVAVTTHRYTLAHALVKWPEAKIILTIRSPIDIFRSAFVSRKNQGWPGHDSPHTAQEIIVFSHFDSAGELATALDSEDKIRRDLAVLSMENIRHVGKCLKWYLQGVKFLRNNKDRIAMIINVADLHRETDNLFRLIGISDYESPKIPAALNQSNSSTYEFSEKEVANLERWYEKDIKIYHFLTRLQKKRQRRKA